MYFINEACYYCFITLLKYHNEVGICYWIPISLRIGRVSQTFSPTDHEEYASSRIDFYMHVHRCTFGRMVHHVLNEAFFTCFIINESHVTLQSVFYILGRWYIAQYPTWSWQIQPRIVCRAPQRATGGGRWNPFPTVGTGNVLRTDAADHFCNPSGGIVGGYRTAPSTTIRRVRCPHDSEV